MDKRALRTYSDNEFIADANFDAKEADDKPYCQPSSWFEGFSGG